jgi:hypothetical protein
MSDDDLPPKTHLSIPMRVLMAAVLVGGMLWLIILYGLYFGVPFIWDLVFGAMDLR